MRRRYAVTYRHYSRTRTYEFRTRWGANRFHRRVCKYGSPKRTGPVVRI